MLTIEKYKDIKTAYLSSLKTITQSASTYDKYEGVLNDFEKFLEQNYTNCEQPNITPIMVLAYKEELNRRSVCRNTMRHYLIILRSFFKWCVQHKFYVEQPVFESDIPKAERVEYDLLTEHEVNHILSGEIPKYTKHGNRNRAIIFLLLLTGLRVSELINLRNEDIDFINKSITIVGKGNKKRTTSLPNKAIDILKIYIKEKLVSNTKSNLLFENDYGMPFTRQNITQIIERYIEKLTGHKHIGSHDLRHAYASILITNNVSIPTISAALGHSNWETTAIYATHLCPQKQVSEVNNVLDSLFT